jgi:hypothetical protein
MKRFGKIALGALMLTGAAVATAEARTSFGIGIGGPAYGGGYYGGGYGGGGASCDPRSRWYDPYRCGGEYDSYDSGYYSEPYYGGYAPGIILGIGGYGGGRGGYGGGYGHGGGYGGGGHHR